MSSRTRSSKKARLNKKRKIRAAAARSAAGPPEEPPSTDDGPSQVAEEPSQGTEADAERAVRLLAAAWWGDVWPFKEDATRKSNGRGTEPEARVEPEAPPAAPVATEQEAGAAALVGVGAEGSRRGRPASQDDRTWRLAGVTAVVAAAAVIIGLVTWRELTPRPEDATVGAQPRHGYGAPVHLDRNTSYVRSDILPSGGIEVTHWIRTGRAVQAVQLTVPHVPGLRPAHVHVTHVVLASNGIPATVQPGSFHGNTTIPLPPSHELFIRYRLFGVLEHAAGSDDRALARITALDVSTAGRLLSTTRTVVGATVLALACTSERDAVPVPCGSNRGGTWATRLGQNQQHSQVMAQVDLPARHDVRHLSCHSVCSDVPQALVSLARQDRSQRSSPGT